MVVLVAVEVAVVVVRAVARVLAVAVVRAMARAVRQGQGQFSTIN
jgi:hypothetical protein